MKTFKYIVVATLMLGASLPSMGQVVRRSERDKDKKESNAAGVTDRMKEFYEPSEVSDANKMWERIVYRQIDLTKSETWRFTIRKNRRRTKKASSESSSGW